ncbi:hypothetical protein [Corynebacterium nuruki]|uniref:hypothetical protein n=1 Tax=Corynebacterium nuruki TaxID=1032851 RepID=UPI0039BEDC94
MTTPVGLIAADQIGLLECHWWGTVTNRTVARSLISLGLVEAHPARDEFFHLTREGLVLMRRVRATLPEGTRPIRVRDVEPGDWIAPWPHDTPMEITSIIPAQYANVVSLKADPVGWALAEERVVLKFRKPAEDDWSLDRQETLW